MIKKLAMICGVAALACSGGLMAQEAAKKAAAGGGSGNVRGLDKDEYAEMAQARLARLNKGFEERKRNKDPFGLALDPGLIKEEPVAVAAMVEEKKVVVPVKVVSLQDAVDKFQVNGVNAAKQMVMVGFRSLRRGDPVEIEHDGELFKLRIVKISVDEVVFMNTKNQETASVRLGVVKGIKGPGKEGSDSIKESVVKPGSTFKVKE
jgi:hypothetical protein